MPEPVTMTVDLDELGKSIDDLEARFANCSNREQRGHLKEELQNLGDYLNSQLVAAVAEARQAVEELADIKTQAGDATGTAELRQMAERLAEMARRRQEAA